MTKWLSLALVLALACAQPSCSVFQQQKHTEEEEKEEETAKIPPPLHLGAVHQVIPERHFALLRIIGPMPKEGTVLISHPADGAIDRVGNLMVSSGQHRRGNIIVADIRSGTVIKGDRVFLYRSIAAGNEDEEELPQEDVSLTAETDMVSDESLPDFNSTSVISDAGHSPFVTASRPEPEPEIAPIPESEPQPRQEPTRNDIPDKLLDVPDTLDGWN